jgi:hypothetical protein
MFLYQDMMQQSQTERWAIYWNRTLVTHPQVSHKTYAIQDYPSGLLLISKHANWTKTTLP